MSTPALCGCDCGCEAALDLSVYHEMMSGWCLFCLSHHDGMVYETVSMETPPPSAENGTHPEETVSMETPPPPGENGTHPEKEASHATVTSAAPGPPSN